MFFCNKSNKSLEGLSSCIHEEYDSILLHAVKQRIKSVLIKACDTDMLYLFLQSVFLRLSSLQA